MKHAPAKPDCSPAIFLDRDGVINADSGYISRVQDFRFLPDTFDALRAMQRLNYKLIVVTNQSGIGRGLYSETDYHRVNAHMLAELASAGIVLTAVYHCPHAPTAGCDCRKPAPGMILRARDELRIDLARSWLVGDKHSDIEAARRAGIRHTVLVRSGQPTNPLEAKALFVEDSILAMIRHLPNQEGEASEIHGR